ncbi:MAG TPA: transporter substrate-binding domain-containing protein [Acidimicrobiales bacterium]|jgi:polar amino acid transport system substrate-binding protein|nr:transporter substrate-binding domain-containing protein [Acidimicrobiales bacterium]
MRATWNPLAIALLTAALLVGIGASSVASGAARRQAAKPPTLAACLKLVKSEVIAKAKMTVATNDPALSPWFVNNNPGNEKGYEAAVAYHVASTLGLKSTAVTWYDEPYELAVTAGAKPFDFDINEITYNAKLNSKVTFSQTYFTVNQSIVALKTSKIVTHHSPSALKGYLYGEPTGSPGLTFVTKHIVPKRAPVVYKTMVAAIAALEAKKIDAIVVDTPSGQYIASQQVLNGVQVAQFHATGEHYSLLLHKGNPLVACVNTALTTLSKSGELRTLSKKYLSIYNSIAFITP